MENKERAQKTIPIKCPGCRGTMQYQDSYQNIQCSSENCATAASWMSSASGYIIYSFRFPDRPEGSPMAESTRNENHMASAYEQRVVRFIRKLRNRLASKKPMANNIPFSNQLALSEEELEEFLEMNDLTLKDFREIRRRATHKTNADLAGEFALKPEDISRIRKMVITKNGGN